MIQNPKYVDYVNRFQSSDSQDMMNSMIKSNYGKTLDEQQQDQAADDSSPVDGGNSIIQN